LTLRLSGGRKLLSPPGSTARPTAARVRLAVMNLVAADLAGARWLDLCCGSGVIGCEALQRGAELVVAVDQDRRMTATASANLTAVRSGLQGAPDVRVLCRTLPGWLAIGSQHRSSELGTVCFDLIYLDPPYASGLQPQICQSLAAGGWLAPQGRLLMECASKAPAFELPGWRIDDLRRYGSTSLMLLSPERCHGGIDSRPPRTGPQS